ncbi:hypothetical protein TWF694_006121 [Orbilia ellipsospora]|uniref:Peptidase A1 domain-containing protein n=1 Tax=Orbilia ellipsospora TaxID=2528407 RepID=A0AAV9WRC6_9PEZI
MLFKYLIISWLTSQSTATTPSPSTSEESTRVIVHPWSTGDQYSTIVVYENPTDTEPVTKTVTLTHRSPQLPPSIPTSITVIEPLTTHRALQPSFNLQDIPIEDTLPVNIPANTTRIFQLFGGANTLGEDLYAVFDTSSEAVLLSNITETATKTLLTVLPDGSLQHVLSNFRVLLKQTSLQKIASHSGHDIVITSQLGVGVFYQLIYRDISLWKDDKEARDAGYITNGKFECDWGTGTLLFHLEGVVLDFFKVTAVDGVSLGDFIYLAPVGTVVPDWMQLWKPVIESYIPLP